MIFGWITDWMTKLSTEYSTITAMNPTSPFSSSPMSAAGMRPMTNPTLGMKFVTNDSTAQTSASGTPMNQSPT